MATARKAWFRVSDTIVTDAWPRDLKLAWVLMLGMMNTRWARGGLTPEQACSPTFSLDEIRQITGKSRRDVAQRCLQRLADVVGDVEIIIEGDFYTIHAPKVAKFQQWPPDSRATVTREPSQSAPAPAPAPSEGQDTHFVCEPSAPSEHPREETPQESPAVEQTAKQPARSVPIVSAAETDTPHPLDTRLLNLLARYDGERDEKLAWLEHELPLIEAEAERGTGTVKSLSIRYYRSYLRGERRFRGWAKRQAAEAAADAWQREHEGAWQELVERVGVRDAMR